MYAPITRLREQGVLPDIDPISLTFCLVGCCQTLFLLAPEVCALSGRDVFAPEEIERHAKAVIRLFLRD